MVRSFQDVRLFNRLSCLQNVMMAVQHQPGENFGTFAAGICTFWPGWRGFTPSRAFRKAVENLPTPVKVTTSTLGLVIRPVLSASRNGNT